LPDPVQDLVAARATLINHRRGQARLLANPGIKTNELMQSFLQFSRPLRRSIARLKMSEERSEPPTATGERLSDIEAASSARRAVGVVPTSDRLSPGRDGHRLGSWYA
jgi:hypothetical protein